MRVAIPHFQCLVNLSGQWGGLCLLSSRHRTPVVAVSVAPASWVCDVPVPPVDACAACCAHSTCAAQVRCVSPDPTGQWLLTGSDDGSMRMWEVLTGRCCRQWDFGGKVSSVAWCPDPALRLASAAVGNRLVLVDSGVAPAAAAEAVATALTPPEVDVEAAGVVARWVAGEQGGLDVCHNHPLRGVHWHSKCGTSPCLVFRSPRAVSAANPPHCAHASTAPAAAHMHAHASSERGCTLPLAAAQPPIPGETTQLDVPSVR